MSNIYAIPDLHGRLDLLEAALVAIEADSKGTPYQVVTLGDYIDRGPHSKQVIDRIMDVQFHGLPLIALMGNHEHMMLASIAGREPPSLWLRNGGTKTLESYGADLSSGQFDARDIPDAHVRWLTNLPMRYVDDHRIYVHAGIIPDYSLDEQGSDIMLWMRYPEGYEYGHGDRHVVHGHTPHAEPLRYSGRTNLDTKAWKTGRLHVGKFINEIPGGPVEILELTAPNATILP
jgi:serine/threonine protein phosphatase 1